MAKLSVSSPFGCSVTLPSAGVVRPVRSADVQRVRAPRIWDLGALASFGTLVSSLGAFAYAVATTFPL